MRLERLQALPSGSVLHPYGCGREGPVASSCLSGENGTNLTGVSVALECRGTLFCWCPRAVRCWLPTAKSGTRPLSSQLKPLNERQGALAQLHLQPNLRAPNRGPPPATAVSVSRPFDKARQSLIKRLRHVHADLVVERPYRCHHVGDSGRRKPARQRNHCRPPAVLHGSPPSNKLKR